MANPLSNVSYATKTMPELMLNYRAGADVRGTRSGYALSSSLVPDEVIAYPAAKAEELFRNAANDFASEGNLEEAERVLRVGVAKQEAYLRKFGMGRRVIEHTGSMLSHVVELQAHAESIMRGEASPMPREYVPYEEHQAQVATAE